MARGCPSLTTLDLSQWPGLTDAGLVKVASSGKFASLKRLLLSQCPGVGDAGIRATLDGCQALEELSAGGCNAVEFWSKDEVLVVFKCFPGNIAAIGPALL